MRLFAPLCLALVAASLGGTAPVSGPIAGPLEIGVLAGSELVSASASPLAELDLFVSNHSETAGLDVRVDADCTFANGVRQSVLHNYRVELGPGQGTVLFVTFPISSSAGFGQATLIGKAVARTRVRGEILSAEDSAIFRLVP